MTNYHSGNVLLPRDVILHVCDPLQQALDEARAHPRDLLYSAIHDIWVQDGRWFAGNSEYGMPVNFCPFCGDKLK